MPDYGCEDKEIEALIGCVFSTISGDKDSEELVFWMANGSSFKMYHSQDCCESVHIEDICGELDWLINAPILEAYENSSDMEIDHLGNEINAGAEHDKNSSWEDYSQTWTFYRITTVKGTVTIRWYGSSNGYYSESVNVVFAPAEAVVEAMADIVEDEDGAPFPWCVACNSYHHPKNPTCKKLAQAVAVAPVFTFAVNFDMMPSTRRIKDS
jgi:hypothetical protein